MKGNIVSENGVEKPTAYDTTRYKARYIISGNNHLKSFLWSLIRRLIHSWNKSICIENYVEGIMDKEIYIYYFSVIILFKSLQKTPASIICKFSV